MSNLKTDHRYAAGLAGDRVTCACGHAEPLEGSLTQALVRMNAHIRASYSDEEWEARMQKTKLALIDAAMNTFTLPPEGPKS